MSRAERRRALRAQAKSAPPRVPTSILGAENNVLGTLKGQTAFDAIPTAALGEKVRGEHRWIAVAAYVMSQDELAGAFEERVFDVAKMYSLNVGCFDCELPLGSAPGFCTAAATGDAS